MYTHINNPMCVYTYKVGPRIHPTLSNDDFTTESEFPRGKKKCGSAGFHQPKGMAIY